MINPVTIINIYPYPLTNLKIKDDWSSEYFSYTSAGDHYVSEDIVTAGDSVTISADGYVTQNVLLEFGTMTVTLQPSQPPKTYISELSDGTNVYTIKDAEARTTLNSKQDTLVSGTNIKTVGGSSILGSGNISIPTTTSSVTSGSTAALTSGGAYTALQSYQTTANLVTSVSSSSTNSQYPSAKLFYDTCGDIETLINAL